MQGIINRENEALLTQKELKRLFCYNRKTGQFIRRVNVGSQKAGTTAGYENSDGYIRISIHGKRYFAHRLAFFYVHKRWPEDQIDHVNQIRSDNRIDNLRETDNSKNKRNAHMQSNNTSGHTGVSWHKWNKKWMVQGTDQNGNIVTEYYDTFEDAVRARHLMEIEFGYSENHGRRKKKS